MEGAAEYVIEAKVGPADRAAARERAMQLFRLGIIAFFAGTALLLPGCGKTARAELSAVSASHQGAACATTRVVDR